MTTEKGTKMNGRAEKSFDLGAALLAGKVDAGADKPGRSDVGAIGAIKISPELVSEWEVEWFQRDLVVNKKVEALAAKIAGNGGVVPGVISIGVVDGVKYIIDGQHRREAFLLSGLQSGIATVWTRHFRSIDAMGDEFVHLNSRLVSLRPDDVLRGMERSHEPLSRLRARCPFVGFDQIRRSQTGPVLSMNQTLVAWLGADSDTPKQASGSAKDKGERFSLEDAESCADFLEICMRAWSRDHAYQRLWGLLNLSLCAWLYRRAVLRQYNSKVRQIPVDMFEKCLMALSASGTYCSWLVGRGLNDRDRSPAYHRLRQIFIARTQEETGEKMALPTPSWFTGR